VIDTVAIRMRGNRGGQQQATEPGRSGRKRVTRILAALERSIPQAKVELSYRNHLELLVSTILSAQCTDQRVNQVTPKLFSHYRRAVDYAGADPGQLEAIIRPTGFYKSKARNLVACGRVLTDQFSGEVPDTMDALVTLPGVGRKTANVILGTCFGKPAVVVDTHVKRVSQRLGLAASGDPTRIEHALQQLIPRRAWTLGSQRLLLHGRYVCVARKPKCEECAVYSECNWAGKRPR
jgi:endonuclease III